MFRLARTSRRTGIPLAEVAGAERERRIVHRRSLLGAAAAGLALPLLPGCETDGPVVDTPEPDPTLPTVAIIGAGIAGLHCAYRLSQIGIRATVYEASKRLGGRMFSDVATFAPMHCEMGGEFIDTPHETMQGLATELGIELRDFALDDPELAPIFHFGGKVLTEAEILEGFAPIAKKIDEDLGTLIDQEDPFVYYDKPNGGEALNALSLAAWLDKGGFSGPVRDLVEIAYTREFGVEPDKLNCLNMMVLISTDTEEFSVFGASDERFNASGGNEVFIQRLAQTLDADQIQMGVAMEAIREEADGRYTVSLLRSGTPEEITVDHVVLALPFFKLRDLQVDLPLPDPQKLAIQEIGYGKNTKLMCGFGSRPWRDFGGNGEIFTDRPFQAGWDTSRLQAGDAGIFTNYLGGNRAVEVGKGTPFSRMTEFLDDVDGVIEGMKAATNGLVQRATWDISYSCYLVGHYTKFTGSESIPYNGVHFCGEHTSLDYQGWMEGGAVTGVRAAAEIAEAAGLGGSIAYSLKSKPKEMWGPSERIWHRGNLLRHTRRIRPARARIVRPIF